MLQSLATFGAGVFTGQGLQTCHASLPQCSLGEDRARLLVRCHGAQIPSLPAPGVLSRQRPQLSIRLGATEKQTGPGDFMESEKLCGMPDCNWRFGDVMTFLVTVDDVLREGGLRFSLLSKTDFRFGPLQMELAQTVELGAGALDLRDALLTCAPVQSQSPFAQPATRCWDSPVLRIDLIQLQSACPLDVAAAAFVSITYFGDPSSLLQKAEKADKPLLKRIAGPCLDPCHCGDPPAQGSVIPSFAEPDSEQPPNSEYTTCEVPSFLYNSWSPEAGSFASPDPLAAGHAKHFVWPGARSRDAETLCTTGLKGFAAGKQGIQTSPQDGLSPSTSLPQPLVVKLRLQQPVPSTKLESDGLPT
ncbi:ilvE [Symbiodinium sp. CCMP2592]|nr:ilvE [Symbiodinium sp. CCMP2592]